MQAKRVREPSRSDRCCRAGRSVHTAARRRRRKHLTKLTAPKTKEDAGKAASERCSIQCCVVESLIAPLEQQALAPL